MHLLNAMMKRFVQTGRLTIIDAAGHEHVHQGAAPGPQVTIRLTNTKLYRDLLLKPELRTGEAYMDGTLVIEQGTIRDLLMLFAANRSNLRRQPVQKTFRQAAKKLRALARRNSPKQARANVAHHYDLSNDLYRLFLDDDLNYSCGYFRHRDDTLEQAQQNKLRHIAAKLQIAPGQRILDIGCGWGGMAMFLAEHADVEVLGITLSEDQHALASKRADERGLADKVRFELMDYRNVQGTFDRIVSIGMFEHVGLKHYTEFFQKTRALMKEDGVALIHTIGKMGTPGPIAPWMRKYIFPGAYLPTLSEVTAAIEKAGLLTTDIEIWRQHYAETLLNWDKRFQTHRDQIAGMFDERFCRMWEFYLIIGEIGFRYGKQVVFQVQLTKSQTALPVTRDYIHETWKKTCD